MTKKTRISNEATAVLIRVSTFDIDGSFDFVAKIFSELKDSKRPCWFRLTTFSRSEPAELKFSICFIEFFERVTVKGRALL